jgi:RNA polymerase sigma-70 factor (ECF subfamily)
MTADSSPDRRFATLMQAAQAGDQASYAQLLEEIAPRVRRLIRRRRGGMNPDAIEDLVQDVLLSVHSVRSTYDPDRPFLPWLLAIARNRLVDSARRYARRAAREVLVDDLDVTFSDESANTSTAVPADSAALQAAIRALPPGQRDAIEMLKLREMSLKEAAAASGTSVGALKVATHRAMQALRKALTRT